MGKNNIMCIVQNCYVVEDEQYLKGFCYHLNSLKQYAAIVNDAPAGTDTHAWMEQSIQKCDIFIAFISPESINNERFNHLLNMAIQLHDKIKIFALLVKPYHLKYEPIARYTHLPAKGWISQEEDVNETWVGIVKALEIPIKDIFQRKNSDDKIQQVENHSFFQQFEQRLAMDEKYWKKADFFFKNEANLTWTYDFLNRHKNAFLEDAAVLSQKNTQPSVMREVLYRIDARASSLKMLFLDVGATNHPVYRDTLLVQDLGRLAEKELNEKSNHISPNVLLESRLLTLENKLAKLIAELRLLIEQTPQFSPN